MEGLWQASKEGRRTRVGETAAGKHRRTGRGQAPARLLWTVVGRPAIGRRRRRRCGQAPAVFPLAIPLVCPYIKSLHATVQVVFVR